MGIFIFNEKFQSHCSRTNVESMVLCFLLCKMKWGGKSLSLSATLRMITCHKTPCGQGSASKLSVVLSSEPCLTLTQQESERYEYLPLVLLFIQKIKRLS